MPPDNADFDYVVRRVVEGAFQFYGHPAARRAVPGLLAAYNGDPSRYEALTERIEIPARRVWLRGQRTGRFALLLSFAPIGNFSGLEAALIPGLQLHADLHFYPGQPELRAVVGSRHGSPAAAGRPAGAGANGCPRPAGPRTGSPGTGGRR